MSQPTPACDSPYNAGLASRLAFETWRASGVKSWARLNELADHYAFTYGFVSTDIRELARALVPEWEAAEVIAP